MISTSRPLSTSHPDFAITGAIERKLFNLAGGSQAIADKIPPLLRQAVDEVIDAPRTIRLTIDQLEKTEKTYIGTKVEILIRDFFGLPKGLLDLSIDGRDVDIKNTVGNNWMIPSEAIGKPCILVACNEDDSVCSLGIVVAHLSYLTSGGNRDGKKTISSAGKLNIHWIMRDHPYPRNFWLNVPTKVAQYILSGKSGNARVEALFTELDRQPIPRRVVETVAHQQDFMKRLRKNGGARDRLSSKRIAILSGTYDGALISSLGLPPIASDEFIGVRATTGDEVSKLMRAGKII